MNFLKVLDISQKIEAGKHTEVLAFINNYYNPRTCLDLVNSIKDDIFSRNSIYPVDRKVGKRNYKLNLEFDNLMVVHPEDDEIIEGDLIYKVNFPNIISLENQFINAVSIIKSVYINDKWVEVDSYQKDNIIKLYESLPADDISNLAKKYKLYQEKINKFSYISIGSVNESLSFERLTSFIFENFAYEGDNLRSLQLSLMRHFHFTYRDFESLDFFEALKLIKVGNKLIEEENKVDDNNKTSK